MSSLASVHAVTLEEAGSSSAPEPVLSAAPSIRDISADAANGTDGLSTSDLSASPSTVAPTVSTVISLLAFVHLLLRAVAVQLPTIAPTSASFTLPPLSCVEGTTIECVSLLAIADVVKFRTLSVAGEGVLKRPGDPRSSFSFPMTPPTGDDTTSDGIRVAETACMSACANAEAVGTCALGCSVEGDAKGGGRDDAFNS